METEGLSMKIQQKLPCIRCRHMHSIGDRSTIGSLTRASEKMIQLQSKSIRIKNTQSLSSYLIDTVCQASQGTPEP